MITTQQPYQDYMGIMDSLKGYASPRSKLTTMIKKGELIKVRRGLYLSGDHSGYSTKTLANIIYGPSYISFESALSYYGMIPERVQAITSACFNKNKNKQFKTPVGLFLYRYIHPRVYPYGIHRVDENGEGFLIASPEKAVCDTLSKFKDIKTMAALNELLYDDLRMDQDSVMRLDKALLNILSGLYRKKIIQLLCDCLED